MSLYSVLGERSHQLAQLHGPGNGMDRETVHTNEYVADMRIVDVRNKWLEEWRIGGSRAGGSG